MESDSNSKSPLAMIYATCGLLRGSYEKEEAQGFVATLEKITEHGYEVVEKDNAWFLTKKDDPSEEFFLYEKTDPIDPTDMMDSIYEGYGAFVDAHVSLMARPMFHQQVMNAYARLAIAYGIIKSPDIVTSFSQENSSKIVRLIGEYPLPYQNFDSVYFTVNNKDGDLDISIPKIDGLPLEAHAPLAHMHYLSQTIPIEFIKHKLEELASQDKTVERRMLYYTSNALTDIKAIEKDFIVSAFELPYMFLFSIIRQGIQEKTLAVSDVDSIEKLTNLMDTKWFRKILFLATYAPNGLWNDMDTDQVYPEDLWIIQKDESGAINAAINQTYITQYREDIDENNRRIAAEEDTIKESSEIDIHDMVSSGCAVRTDIIAPSDNPLDINYIPENIQKLLIEGDSVIPPLVFRHPRIPGHFVFSDSPIMQCLEIYIDVLRSLPL